MDRRPQPRIRRFRHRSRCRFAPWRAPVGRQDLQHPGAFGREDRRHDIVEPAAGCGGELHRDGHRSSQRSIPLQQPQLDLDRRVLQMTQLDVRSPPALVETVHMGNTHQVDRLTTHRRTGQDCHHVLCHRTGHRVGEHHLVLARLREDVGLDRHGRSSPHRRTPSSRSQHRCRPATRTEPAVGQHRIWEPREVDRRIARTSAR